MGANDGDFFYKGTLKRLSFAPSGITWGFLGFLGSLSVAWDKQVQTEKLKK